MIVDASIALRWVLRTQRDERADRLLVMGPLWAPPILLAEVGHILTRGARDRRHTPPEARAYWEFIRRSVVVDAADIADEMFRLSLRLHVTCFDAAYLALAVLRRDRVATADDRFAGAVRADPEFADLIVPISEL